MKFLVYSMGRGNEVGHNVTVNEERYKAVINDFFVPELKDVDADDFWFQQDGGICYTANETINLEGKFW